MLQIVRRRPTPRPRRSDDLIAALAYTATAAESAARGAVAAVQATCVMVRNYPVLSVFLATGIGYLAGKARGSISRPRP